MIIKTKKVYYCKFCNKHMLSAGFMTIHELHCRKDPKNQHKCFQYCKHLIKKRDMERTDFYCEITKKHMYSYKVENKDWFCNGGSDFSEHIRMPLECKYYDIEDGHYDYLEKIEKENRKTSKQTTEVPF